MNLTFPGVNGSARILGLSNTAVSGAADTNENILGTITIPAGAMGANGLIRVSGLFTNNNNANNKTFNVRFSGIGGTLYFQRTVTTTTTLPFLIHIGNRGATNSQGSVGDAAGNSWGISSGNPRITSSVDTTAVTTIVMTGTKAVGGDTATLESFLGELILP